MAVKPFHAIGLFPSKGTNGMTWVKLFEFEAVVCGYHYDGKWVSVENQELDCLHEVDNPDYYLTINSFESARVKIVGHMPMEMSRPTKFLLQRGAVIKATLSSTNCRKTLLVQDGLEMPSRVSVSVPVTLKNM